MWIFFSLFFLFFSSLGENTYGFVGRARAQTAARCGLFSGVVSGGYPQSLRRVWSARGSLIRARFRVRTQESLSRLVRFRNSLFLNTLSRVGRWVSGGPLDRRQVCVARLARVCAVRYEPLSQVLGQGDEDARGEAVVHVVLLGGAAEERRIRALHD